MTFTPEALLGEQDGAALRRFLEWGVGDGFDLAIVQMSTPWKRKALREWIASEVSNVATIALDQVGPGKRRLWDLLREAQAAASDVLVFDGLDEVEDPLRTVAQLNVERDELVREFALPWVMFVHPRVAQVMEKHAPDFVDFAGLWLYEEKPELLRLELSAIGATPGLGTNVPVEAVGGDVALLTQAQDAVSRGYLDEATDLLAQFDLRNPKARDEDPRRIFAEGYLLLARSRLGEAKAAFEAARQMTVGDAQAQAAIVQLLGNVFLAMGQLDEARALVQEAIAIGQTLGDPAKHASRLAVLARIELSQGHSAAARRVLEEALATFEEGGIVLGRGLVLRELAEIAILEGDDERASALLDQAVVLPHWLGDRRERGVTLNMRATLELRRGNTEKARELLQAVLSIAEQTGDALMRADALYELAHSDVQGRKLAEARAHVAEAIAIYREAGAREKLAFAELFLGQIELLEGRFQEARRLFEGSLKTLEELGSGQLDASRVLLKLLDTLEHPPRA